MLLSNEISSKPRALPYSIGGKEKEQKEPPEVLSKKGLFLKFLQIFEENTCAGVSFQQGLQACNKVFRGATLLKRDSNTCFPVKFAEFLRTPILKNICERLLLKRVYELLYFFDVDRHRRTLA